MFIKDTIFLDALAKTAIIMRDGMYLYLPSELGIEGTEPLKVYRPKSEVKKAYNRFVELKTLPVTVDHPNEFLELNDKSSYKDGIAVEPDITTQDGYTVMTCKLELDADSIKEYEDGTRELSCGWEGDFEQVEGQEYKFIQRFKDFNHVAMVKKGRCGSICKIQDGGFTMPEKILEILKMVLEKLGVQAEESQIQGALAEIPTDAANSMESKETPEEEKKEDQVEIEVEKEKEEKDAESSEANEPFHVEMDTEKLVSLLEFAGVDPETAKSKVAEFLSQKKDEFPKKEEPKEEEAKDECGKETKDSKAIIDAFAKGEKANKERMLKRFADVMPLITAGEFTASELEGKTPCQIKSMFIKKHANTDISDSDAGLDAVFNMTYKNFKHPSWSKVVDAEQDDLASRISKISFKK